MVTKKCYRCRVSLSITEFHKSTKGTLGVSGYCKVCQGIRQKEWRKNRKGNIPEPKKSNKVCSDCKRDLPISDFYVGTYGSGGLQSSCKSCQKEKSKNWKKSNPDQVRNTSKAWWEKNKNRIKDLTLRRDYGISLEEYEVFLSNQKGVCAICKNPSTEGKGRLDVDHNHSTGRVRGLLCNSCNRGIGFLKDCPSTLRAAADYIESR